MQRVRTFLRNQFMCFHTHHDIGRFDADHQILISHPLNHMNFVQCAFHDSFRSHASVFFNQLFFQRAAVYAHTNRHIVFFGLFNYGSYPVLASNISRIDPDLICTVLDRRDCKSVIKMNIRNQRDMDLFLDLF